MTELQEPPSLWIHRYHPNPDAAALVVALPHAGGSASYFFALSRALSPDAEVLAVQYPGRQNRRGEPGIDDLHRLADLVTAELLPWTDRPLLLFGHSMGATLGFEIAVRLERAGVVPRGLVVTGRGAPSRARNQMLHQLADGEFMKMLQSLAGTDPRMFQDPQVVEMILPALRNDYRAAETYRYRSPSPLSTPVIAVIGDQDAMVSTPEAEGWGDHTDAGFTLGVLPGGHFFLNDHVPALVEMLRAAATGRPVTVPGRLEPTTAPGSAT